MIESSATQPLLSFCIPTCNRPAELKRLLSQLIPQLLAYRNEVELIIKDDSESDQDIASENYFKESGLKGSYLRGVREGIDRANLFIANQASGEYVWWCGDDEELLDGAISRVMSILSTRVVNFVFVNYKLMGVNNAANENINRLIDANELIEIAGNGITLLSTGIFRRRLGLMGMRMAESYIGTAFASQPIIFSAITYEALEKKIYFLGEPYLINNPTVLTEDGLFYDGVNAFGITYFKLINQFSPPLDVEVVDNYLKNNFGHIWRGLVIDWIRRNIPAPRNRLWDLRMYAKYPEYWLALLVFIMPKFLIKNLLYLYKLFFKKHYKQV